MFAIKAATAFETQSSSMFAESMHSLADVLNESLLLFGVYRSLKEPDATHPYGFISERYAWALVSGVGVFFLGGGVTLYHGISNFLLNSHVVTDISNALYALGGCLLFESVTLSIAARHIYTQAMQAKQPFWEYFHRGADPASVQVFMEDSAAFSGVVIAGCCLLGSKALDLPWLDSMGSICIGGLLSVVAIFLVKRNIQGLLQVRMDLKREQEIVRLLEADPIVKSVHDVKSTSIGCDWSRFKAEILFDGKAVAARYLEQNPYKAKMDIALLREAETNEEIEAWMISHGASIVSILGKEVDRLELEIQRVRPEVKHIDLEIL
ncbi:hypothetical protein HDU91_006387 [Kappamyces sp. JEL0680]|nr:hypothetical protein HDU91_006387 [Kappamyces sp. JEL0680]